ncbi:putative TatD family hydrolase [Seiridium cardinale]|uniref:TatD family hydrolase n=1 Tax=Seiridium cardinale TaxID=138064 RepID=A0ABR2X8N8_9PEZI
MDLTRLPDQAPTRATKSLQYADLDRALTAGVEKAMFTGMSSSDIPTNLDIAQSHPSKSCFVTVSVQPYYATEPSAEGPAYYEKHRQSIQHALAEDPCPLKAFGKLGLDYDRLNHADKGTQIATFKAQLDMFVEEKWDLPLFLYCRTSFDDFVQVIGPYVEKLPRRGLVHSFVGTKA